MSRRAQVVLAAAVVVAVALVPMLLVYLQLGYPAGAAAEATDDDGLADARHYLDRATTDATEDVRGLDWSERDTTARRLNSSLANATARLEARGAARDRSYRVAPAPETATRLAREDCPGGEHRAFGACESARGIVLQRRANQTTVVAVAFSIRVRSPRGTTNATVVVRPPA